MSTSASKRPDPVFVFVSCLLFFFFLTSHFDPFRASIHRIASPKGQLYYFILGTWLTNKVGNYISHTIYVNSHQSMQLFYNESTIVVGHIFQVKRRDCKLGQSFSHCALCYSKGRIAGLIVTAQSSSFIVRNQNAISHPEKQSLMNKPSGTCG